MTHSVGVLGLGELGGNIARRLVDCGFEVHGFDPNPDVCSSAAADGIVVEHAPQAVVAAAEGPTILVVGTVRHAQDACRSEGTLNAIEGKVLLVMSTLDPETVLQLDAIVREHAGMLVDAPCAGGVDAARSGQLSMMLAGAPASLALVRPVLDCLGSRYQVVSEQPGMAQVMKLVTQIAMAINMAGVHESLAVAEHYGLERSIVLDCISASSGASRMSERWEYFSAHTKAHNVDVITKDLRAIVGRARGASVALPVAEVTLAQFADMWLPPEDKRKSADAMAAGRAE
jgi:3-hydroxyisobutyrate dehydrogenase-like beta-hydroxyacid dehydrogenase